MKNLHVWEKQNAPKNDAQNDLNDHAQFHRHCAECGQEIKQMSNEHLQACCGLTMHEYAIRYGLPLEGVVPQHLINRIDPPDTFPAPTKPDENQSIILAAAEATGVLERDEDFYVIPGEVRRLEQLLWMADLLGSCGFRFRQEYVFNDETHRVLARNRIKARADEVLFDPTFDIDNLSASNLCVYAAVAIALRCEIIDGYLFLHFNDIETAAIFRRKFDKGADISFKPLESPFGQGIWLRTEALSDAESMLSLLRRHLDGIPCAAERFYDLAYRQQAALVAKEMVFDAAHFITDHPGACANLHGGRYKLIVKLVDYVDQHSGFVIDYGLLQKIVKRAVIDKLDHKSLNLVHPELSWRSSTELLSVFIWEQLIDYLPSLFELQIYETEHSYCSYRGPDLAEYRQHGTQSTGRYFSAPNLGRSALRQRLGLSKLSFKMKVMDDPADD